jgi:hypothetical protein
MAATAMIERKNVGGGGDNGSSSSSSFPDQSLLMATDQIVLGYNVTDRTWNILDKIGASVSANPNTPHG